MSDGTEGVANGETVNQPSAKEIFNAEIASLSAAEGGAAKRASDFIRVGDDGGTPAPTEGGTPAPTEGGAEGGAEGEDPKAPTDGEQDGAGQESAEKEEGNEDESSDPSGKKRSNWKKEALESREEVKSIKAELAQIKELLHKTPDKQGPDAGKQDPPAKVEPPQIDISKLDLSDELKELLEFTPGLDKMVAAVAAEAAKAIFDKAEADRTRTEQDRQSEQARAESDKTYWNSMESWLKGEYPELSLPEIRNSSDFADWSNYHESWVNKTLSSTAYDDPSGAQKIFAKYIQDTGLAQQESKPDQRDNRNLAAARTPPIARKGTQVPTDRRSLFAQEAQRLASNKTGFRTTI